MNTKVWLCFLIEWNRVVLCDISFERRGMTLTYEENESRMKRLNFHQYSPALGCNQNIYSLCLELSVCARHPV